MQGLMPPLWSRRTVVVLAVVVLAAAALVHGSDSSARATGKSKAAGKGASATKQNDQLPTGVRDMVELITSAINARRIDDLRDAIDWNEMKPDFGVPVSDPVDHWKAASGDGTGQETLDVLAALLAGAPAVVPLGRDLENNRLFVWPKFAESGLAKLEPAEWRQFERLVPADARHGMLEQGRYKGWRLVLGADGTWHSFRPTP